MRTKIKVWSVLVTILAVLCLMPSVTLAQTVITNGQVIGGLSSTGSQKQYKLSVPADATNLEIKIWGGTGDCDLYVKRSFQPTTTSYDYRPYLLGNNETVTVQNPSSGSWYIMLNAHNAYYGLSLSATYLAALPRVATPTISPAGGIYSFPRTAWIFCGTSGATIRYTTDGTDPTSTSTLFSGAIQVNQSMTLKAKAFKAGMTESYVASATFTIYNPTSGRVATPLFNPAGGVYTGPQLASISCGTAAATIRYTTNGSEPTSSSTIYAGPLAVNTTTTLKAKAFKSGMTDSYTASATYTIISPVPMVIFNNTPVQNISDSINGQKYYVLSVPADLTNLVIKIFGGSGDCDLYVKREALPTTSSYDYRPYTSGNNDTVTVCNPSSGDWYIMLRAWSAYSGVSLLGAY